MEYSIRHVGMNSSWPWYTMVSRVTGLLMYCWLKITCFQLPNMTLVVDHSMISVAGYDLVLVENSK